MDRYKVITLHQPWAQWVIEGFKPWETRIHARFKGLKGKNILIHASKTYNSDGALVIHASPSYPQGVILGICFVKAVKWLGLEHCKEANIDCYGVKRFGLQLEVIEKFDKPIPAKGSQGIWNYEMEENK